LQFALTDLYYWVENLETWQPACYKTGRLISSFIILQYPTIFPKWTIPKLIFNDCDFEIYACFHQSSPSSLGIADSIAQFL
jgi:hypothetical protein